MKRPDANNPRSIRYRMRRKRFRWVEMLLDDVLATTKTATILDIGGRRDYWKLLDSRFHGRVCITILNMAEEVDREDLADDFGLEIETVVGDGTHMPQYADRAFDLTHSNSVIEHVGLYRSMAAFARETRRVGRAYYLQTPNFWFPLEPHYGLPFVHWLPEPTRLYLHSSVNLGFAKKTTFENAMDRVDATRIVSRRLLQHFFPDGTHASERFALMTKSLIVWRKIGTQT